MAFGAPAICLLCYVYRKALSNIVRHVVATAKHSMLRVIDRNSVDDATPGVELFGNEKLDPGRL